MENKHFYFIVGSFVAIVVALSFWTVIGNSVGTVTTLQFSNNTTITIPAQNAFVEVVGCGQANTSAIIVFNTTNGVAYPAANYTVVSAASTTDGYLITQINFTGTNNAFDQVGLGATVDCNYQPRGYATDGGTRAVFNLIPILAALLIMIAAMPDLREWMKGMVSK